MAVALLEAINIIGSRKKLAQSIGATTDAINAWLNRHVHIPLEFALQIQHATNGKVQWTRLTPHLAHMEKILHQIALSPFPAPLIQHLPINKLLPQTLPSITTDIKVLARDIQMHGLKRPIAVTRLDTHYHVIFGLKRLQACAYLDQKTIACYRLSLPDLLADRYVKTQLSEYFLHSERVAIGLTLERFSKTPLGKQAICQKIDKTYDRFDNFLANLLGFGNRQTYLSAKNICRKGIRELILNMDEENLSITTAAQLVKLSSVEQRAALSLPKKQIIALSCQLKPRPLRHCKPNNTQQITVL
jgi:DNA-binding transcriptional regulator YdaS (Cro superfamily)